MKQTGERAEDYVRLTDTCPDCIERGDVDLLGRPRKGRHGRIRICLGCRGSARVTRPKKHSSEVSG